MGGCDRDFAAAGPLKPRFRWQIRTLRETCPSGIAVEAIPGSAQVELRTHAAMVHVLHGRLRIGGDCSTDEH
eukprot:5891461-Alexandrium_andersonii.AAC.1